MKIDLTKVQRFPAYLRIISFLGVLLICWIPWLIIVYGTIYLLKIPINAEVENTITIVVMGFLFLEFLVLLPIWNRRVYRINNTFRHYGLIFSKRHGWELIQGLLIGTAIACTLFIIQGWCGWLEWKPPSIPLIKLLFEGALSALFIGIAEELFFRGWLLDELSKNYRPRLVLWVNGLIFALLHFLKPIDQMIAGLPGFPGLWLFGLIMVLAKWKYDDRLGISIGLHGGMVWAYYIVRVGNLIKYNGNVSDWVTGIHGNPIAGIMGIIFLTILVIYFYTESSSKRVI